LAVAVIATVARADAPPDQYGLFDSTDLVIYDKSTKLTWERGPLTYEMARAQPTFNFDDAAAHCNALSLGWVSYGQRHGPAGWRVPSYKEILTLVDEVPHPEYDNHSLMSIPVAIDSNAFPGTVSGPYWTSSLSPVTATLCQGSTKPAYTVDFYTGQGIATTCTNSSCYVRCVHD
jgi:hypothetical protein